jgi:hypothetical protein
MATEMLSYSQLGERLNCSPEAARALVKRLRLPRQKANDGKVLVSVDLSEINHKPLAARAPADLHPVIASLKGRIEVLQMELAKIEVLASGHRADFERERACRCAHGRAVEDDCRRHGCQGSGGSARRWSGPICVRNSQMSTPTAMPGAQRWSASSSLTTGVASASACRGGSGSPYGRPTPTLPRSLLRKRRETGPPVSELILSRRPLASSAEQPLFILQPHLGRNFSLVLTWSRGHATSYQRRKPCKRACSFVSR